MLWAGACAAGGELGVAAASQVHRPTSAAPLVDDVVLRAGVQTGQEFVAAPCDPRHATIMRPPSARCPWIGRQLTCERHAMWAVADDQCFCFEHGCPTRPQSGQDTRKHRNDSTHRSTHHERVERQEANSTRCRGKSTGLALLVQEPAALLPGGRCQLDARAQQIGEPHAASSARLRTPPPARIHVTSLVAGGGHSSDSVGGPAEGPPDRSHSGLATADPRPRPGTRGQPCRDDGGTAPGGSRAVSSGVRVRKGCGTRMAAPRGC